MNLCHFVIDHRGFCCNFITVYVPQYLNCFDYYEQCYSSASWRMSTKDAINVKIIFKVNILVAF
jgi:hypothetical protein